RIPQALWRAPRAGPDRRHLMATQDDDTLTGPVPDPEAEPTPTELSHARGFAELVDKTLSGRTPPAMSADDRALLEVATVVRATHRHPDLAPRDARSDRR